MSEAPTKADLYAETPAGAATEAAPAGNDTVAAPAGSDTVAAPEGNDTVSGNDSGTDTVSGTDITIKLPDDITVDETRLTEFRDLSAQLGLNSEQAQKLADLGIGLLTAQDEASAKAWTDTIATWEAETDADPHLGGAAKAEAQAIIGRAMDTYGTKEAREAFDLTGAGMNPHVIRFVHNMAKALNEGTQTTQGNPSSRPQRGPAALYGDNA